MTALPNSTYADWAVRLRDHYFTANNAGRPITLFVDDDVLSQIGAGINHGGPVRSFEAAVRSWLHPHAANPFEKVYSDALKWKRGWPTDSTPPSLPLLAATVLAASRMTKGGDYAPHNYYIHFFKIVQLPNELRYQNAYGDVIPDLWEDLGLWLDDITHGKFGHSTIARDEWLTRIGYALSQSLFRQSDRDKLPLFFKKQALTPHAVVSAPEILPYFKRWAMTAPLSPGAKKMTAVSAYDTQLGAMLVQAAAAWDGAERDEEGRRVGRILVTLEFNPRGHLQLFAQRPRGFPAERDVRMPNGASLHLSSSGGDWYDESPLPVSAIGLDSQVRLVSPQFGFQFTPEPVIPMHQDTALGRWVGTARVELGVPHHILCRDALVARVRDVVARAGGEPPEDSSAAVDLPRGYRLLRDVVMIRTPTGPLPDELAVLFPTAGQKPIFIGGLPVDLGPNSYLYGGEPDIVIPPDTAALARTFNVDGEIMNMPVGGGQVALSTCGLPEGAHEIAIGPSRLRFFTSKSLGRVVPEECGTIGYHLHLTDGKAAGRADAAPISVDATDTSLVVCGAAVGGPPVMMPPTAPPPIIVPRGRRVYVFIGTTIGDFDEVRQPDVPGWLAQIPLFPTGFEYYPAFEVAWLLMEGGTGWSVRQVVPRMRPETNSASRDQVRRWCLPILRAAGARLPGDINGWGEFLAVARDEAY